MKKRQSTDASGFTFVEMLVAIALSAIFVGAAALVYQSIATNSKRLTNIVEVEIGESTNLALYGKTGDFVRTYSAPNFGKSAFVQQMRDLMLEDAQQCSAIFCLPRVGINNLHPEFLRYEAGDAGSTKSRPVLDSPEAFRKFLADVQPASAGIFNIPIRTMPPIVAGAAGAPPQFPNTSIFMLTPETNPGFIRVHAVWEIDFMTPANHPGDYASVRRYSINTLTDYYDIYFEDGSGDPFYPHFAAFERKSRNAVTEGTAVDRFKISNGHPFYMVWLPDPANNYLAGAPFTVTDPATSARSAYGQMAGKTGFTVVLPMFPNL